ncbi:MAG: flagellar filament capping protein FliD [Acidobacteriota bacterium]
MGTVGLNFGSPTSGTGFDVTATVNIIVSNLEKVESPWKNQLTALQSQDTVISNLGSLFSALSTDLGKLTDFNGVLAQKTGSSSDTNVLELTSASSSATAGTHSVVVKSLAQTSSGYLDAISNASDPLAGTLTVAVNGNSQTFDLSTLASPTLAGLQTAINSSGLGVTANVLTDASGSRLSLVSNTSGLAGQMTVTSALTDAAAVTSSNPTGALNYNAAVSGQNASLVVDGVSLSSASNTVSNLIPGVTFQLLSTSPSIDANGDLEPVQVVIANDNSGVETAINQLVTDYNSLMKAIDAQEGNDSSGNPEPLFGSPTLSLLQQQLLSGLNAQNPNGYLSAVDDASTLGLSGSMTIQVGSNTPQTITLSSSQTTVADLAAAINGANLGVTAGVVDSNGQSTLTLASQNSGAAGALSVTSKIVNTSGTLLTDTTFSASGGQNSQSTWNGIAGTDTLAGSVTLQVGSGSPVTVDVPSSANTLSGLAAAINNTAGIGVTASVLTNSDGTESLSVVSNTAGSAGNLTVTSTLLDTTSPTSATLGYTNSSDLGSLTALGISMNNDGTMTLDVSGLDSLLNSDFNSVVGFFQNANSWGRGFSTILSSTGNGSSVGILSLAAKSNSSMEQMLNDKIAKEEDLINAQKTRLTAELNKANQILQQLPSQLDGIDQLYSAITGYNQKG